MKRQRPDTCPKQRAWIERTPTSLGSRLLPLPTPPPLPMGMLLLELRPAKLPLPLLIPAPPGSNAAPLRLPPMPDGSEGEPTLKLRSSEAAPGALPLEDDSTTCRRSCTCAL